MIFLSLGSNLGNRLSNLRKAVALLKKKCFSSLDVSIVLETPAILPENAPKSWDKSYLNMVVYGETDLSPIEFLSTLKTIEQSMERPKDHEKWSPRIIDLDILLWNEEIIETKALKIPHPELFNRPFLLHLIAFLSPDVFSPLKPELSIEQIAYQEKAAEGSFTRSFVLYPEFVGIVNVTPDSFSDGGAYLKPDKAIEKILSLHDDGARVIDIGAQSTRPNAKILSSDEEYQRLKPVLEGIEPHIKEKEIMLSIDSCSSETILKVIENHSIAWVNDVSGNLPKETLSHIAKKGCKIMPMHSVTIPPKPDQLISDVQSLFRWTGEKIKQLMDFGFSRHDIILDPGLGFGKSAYQNISLIKQISAMKIFKCPLLVGHSRKSYINTFYPSKASERDLETIAVSEQLYQAGVDYLRVHNILDHQRFFVARKLVK
jgi:2-amino-4-hydroxy-6-hydroxymethyldihydropteridine diphosphokinase / dihydropteroate synthase